MQDVIAIFREVIASEVQALEGLASHLNASASQAVKLILDSKGKVITIGVGKSGFVARKVASTLASTGTLAVFMHPTEASHGDLGMVTRDDVIIAFSKSGESHEINFLLEPLRSIGAKVIAITGELDSTLAKSAHVALFAGVNKEACPMDLAPTSSIVSSLAMGDALAIALMKLKGFKEQDFAQIHPGGRLGKKLLQRVKDIMIPIAKCSALDASSASLDGVMGALGQNLLGLVIVTDASKKLVGILTDGEIRRLLREHREKIFKLKLSELWNSKPVTCQASDLASIALETMEKREKPLNILPVLDGTQVVGAVRLIDIFS